ncbi:hypothetical protein [Bradyrhizobium sp. 18]|nr:hypothetical protein [Bradyrhizobium sp. 18]MCK1503861.1 hypothetical protein [Bradyrhizobium sp. 18]
MTPQQVDAMSMWQFFALVAGASEDSGALTAGEADELWEWLNADGTPT